MLSHLVVAQLSAAMVVSRAPEARDCPDTEHFSAQVERITGSPLVAPESASTVVHADFSRTGNAYQATLRLAGSREGERILRDESPTCEPLADAVVVATALLLDPVSRPPARASSETAVPWLGIWISGRFGAGTGLVGGPTWMAGAGVEATLGAFTVLDLTGTLTGTQESHLGAGGVEVRLWFVALGAFRSLTGETWKFGPALQLMVGSLRGEGTQYPLTSSASLFWLAVGAGLRADVAVGPTLRLGARALAVVPTRKHSFSVGYVGTAYESSTVGGMADLVLDVRLW